MEKEGGNPPPDLETTEEGTKVVLHPPKLQPSRADNPRSLSGPKDLPIRNGDAYRLDELIWSVPDVRQSIVDKIKGDIESGDYGVEAEKIADKMISEGMLRDIE